MVAEARALLAAAERREPVAMARARACVEMTEIDRLAMNVIDGGLFAPARMIELATTSADGNSLKQVTTSTAQTVVSQKTP